MDFVHPVSSVIPGAQGRLLEVLAGTTAELNLRTLARLAGVSTAQASRVLPHLVELGLVGRHDTPPSAQFWLVRTHLAAGPILDLAAARESLLKELGRAATSVAVPPASIIVFGSFARGESEPKSDLDVVFVRPLGVSEDDDGWAESVDLWRATVQTIAGNPVEILEIGAAELASHVTGEAPLWQDIRRDGLVVHGLSVDALTDMRHA